MSAELQSRAAQAVEMAKNAGADEAWATATQSRDVEFNFRDGSLEKVKDTTSRGLNIEVYADGRYSSHQTTDLNPDRLKSFVSEAVAITRALEPDEFRRITPPELFANRPSDDLDLVEANEAFAAQACAVNKDMGWDTDKVNVNGGAIAIGHPIGASGARILNSLLFEMQRRDAKKGLATLCIGGGMGVAMCVERD